MAARVPSARPRRAAVEPERRRHAGRELSGSGDRTRRGADRGALARPARSRRALLRARGRRASPAAVTGWPSASRAGGGCSRSGRRRPPLRRPPRRGRVRPPGDRRQAGAARARRWPPRAGRSPRRSALLAEPEDIVIGFGSTRAGRRRETRCARARRRGCLTIAFAAGAGGASGSSIRRRRPVRPPGAGRDALPRALGAGPRLLRPPRAARGPRAPAASTTAAPRASSTRSSREPRTDLEAVLADVRASVLMKAEEVGELRAQTLSDDARGPARRRRGALRALPSTPAASCSPSATAARRPTRWTWSPTCAPGRRLALAAGARPDRGRAILTAVANDVGIEEIFPRQVIAYGRAGDVAGRASRPAAARENVIAGAGRGAPARHASRSRWSATTAAGSPPRGSPTTSSSARSQHIPRIQEAQASAYHVLRELIELGAG